MSDERKPAIDIHAVQQSLSRDGLSGWLSYDFRGLNEVAQEMYALHKHHITRRWFYFIPAQREPTQLCHKIEVKNVPSLPGQKKSYAGWQELHSLLKNLLAGCDRIAMEYSPMNDVPTVSYVDAGMLELIRSFGVEVISSALLIQEFQARWSEAQLQTHIAAAKLLYDAQGQAFKMIENALKSGQAINEYEVQRFILNRITENGYVTDSAPIVAVNSNASNPHYAPSAEVHSPIQKGDVVLIDLWAKQKTPRAVFGDITWMGYAGSEVPQKVREVFEIVTKARDLGVEFLQKRFNAGEKTHGYEVDEVVRNHITEAGYGEYFVHRTGHSLGTVTHANGVNIDSYETRDSREITPGVAFSIEPGIYLPEFGIRSEINVYMGENGPEVHTQPQKELVTMAV